MCVDAGSHAQLSRFRKARRRTRCQGRRIARARGQRQRHRRRDFAHRGKGRAGAERPLRQSDAVAENPGGAASAASASERFHRRADHRIHAARRRPQVRRGRGADGRLRPLPRREHLRDRPGEGRHHRIPHQAQFRHGAAGRLSQGGAADGDGRPVRHSRAVDRRFRRRLSRHRRGGARTGRGDRALHRRLPVARRAQRRHHHRRRACRAAPSRSRRQTAC